MKVSYTKVWLVEHKLIVADTIHEAIDIWKEWSESHRDPTEVRALNNDAIVCPDNDALIHVED